MSSRFPYWVDPGEKQRPPSLSSFPRPTPVRATLQTQASAIAEPAIVTEDALLAAIANAPYGATPSCYGRSVVLAGDIVVTRTIDLSDSRFSGLRITSVSRSRLIPHADMHGLPLFSVTRDGTDIMVDTLTIYGEAGRLFSTVFEHDGSLRLSLQACDWHADACYTGSATTTSGLRIVGNRRTGGDEAGGVTARLTYTSISGNLNDNSIAINALASSTRVSIANNVGLYDVALAAGCSRFSICGNVACGDIDTSASDGLNVIDGNVACGTITTHATDALGLNT